MTTASEKIRFTIARDAWTEYEADKPEGFDEMDRDDQWITLVELAEAPGATEIGGDTNRLEVLIGDSNEPL